jgi:hypothetical protein
MLHMPKLHQKLLLGFEKQREMSVLQTHFLLMDLLLLLLLF